MLIDFWLALTTQEYQLSTSPLVPSNAFEKHSVLPLVSLEKSPEKGSHRNRRTHQPFALRAPPAWRVAPFGATPT